MFTPLLVVLTIGLASPSSVPVRTDSTPAAKAPRAGAAKVDVITIEGDTGTLQKRLTKEVAKAKAAGKLPVVLITEPPICPPCRALEAAMEHAPLQAAFNQVRVLRIRAVKWETEINTLGYHRANVGVFGDTSFSIPIPCFYGVDKTGHAVGDCLNPAGMEEKDPEATAQAVAPQVAKYFEEARKAKS